MYVGTYCTVITAFEPTWDSKIKAKNEHPGGLFHVFVVFMMFFNGITCSYMYCIILEYSVKPGNLH